MGRVRAEEGGRLVVLGVDPGFAKTGYAVVSGTERGDYRVANGGVITTVKMGKKKRCDLRVTNEDVTRNRKIWTRLEEVRSEYEPYAVGVEAYPIGGWNKGHGKKSAVKTLGVYNGILWWSFCCGFHAAPFIPQDMKRRFCGKQSGSKEQVAEALKEVVGGFSTAISMISADDQEHFSDAVAVAVLMLEDVFEMRKQLGVR